jgi:molybdopterin converting factor small subunit
VPSSKFTQQSSLMSIHVEFFGIARQRAGVAEVDVPCDGTTKLAAIVTALGERFPPLVGECFDQGGLRPGFICNIDGDRFVFDPETYLDSGCTLLIMSADAGG